MSQPPRSPQPATAVRSAALLAQAAMTQTVGQQQQGAARPQMGSPQQPTVGHPMSQLQQSTHGQPATGKMSQFGAAGGAGVNAQGPGVVVVVDQTATPAAALGPCLVCQQPINLQNGDYHCHHCPVGFHPACINAGYHPPANHAFCPVCLVGRWANSPGGSGLRVFHGPTIQCSIPAVSLASRFMTAQTFATNRQQWDDWFELDLIQQPHADQSILIWMGAANYGKLVRYPCISRLGRTDGVVLMVNEMVRLERRVGVLEAENAELKRRLGEGQ